ncbi:MAG: DASS family sodium-coupled anion symporter [Candidatus Brocadiae bacterium]|nr:DASS family sodium-coupled anion symporter [Candidatus Brocadiia bacterium]
MNDVAGDAQRPEADAARFDRMRARIALVLGPALFLLLWFLPLPLPDPAQRLAAVMALVVVFWIGEPVPVAVTALLAPCLALLAGAVPAGSAGGAVRAAFSGFGDPILMLFVGGFFIAEAMTVHGVDRRLAMSILSLRAFSASPARMVVGLGLCSWVLSMWMSNTATTALLIPIAIGMLRVARAGAPPGRLDTSVMLMLPFASTVGGLATPVGTAPNIIGIGQMEKLPGVDIGFLTWMGYGVSIGALMIVALAILLTRGLPAAAADLRGHAVAERSRMGGWSRGERVTVLAFSLAVGGWVFTGLAQAAGWKEIQAFMSARLPEGAIALLAASVLFMIPSARGRRTLTWGEAARIDWGTLLLLGGGLSMGELMKSTGLSDAVGRGAVSALGVESSLALIALSAGLGILLSEITSNTATATMLVPVVISIAGGAGIDPIPPALAATFGCSFGFMLPISTPPNAIAYGTGLIPIATMARKGVVFDLIGFVLIVVGIRVLSPILGH